MVGPGGLARLPPTAGPGGTGRIVAGLRVTGCGGAAPGPLEGCPLQATLRLVDSWPFTVVTCSCCWLAGGRKLAGRGARGR